MKFFEKNKNIKIVAIILTITAIVGVVLGMLEGIGKLNYVSDLKSAATKLEAVGADYSKVTMEWSIYLAFALSPISLLLIGYFDYMIFSAEKNGRTISKWPIVTILVLAALSVLSPLLELATADSEYMLEKLKTIKSDGKWDQVKNVVKPLYEHNVKSFIKWISLSMAIVEVLVTVPGIMQIKKINN